MLSLRCRHGRAYVLAPTRWRGQDARSAWRSFREEANGKGLQGDVSTLQSRVDPKVFAII